MTDGARLLAHSKGAQFVEREALAQYIPPPATETFRPVSHTELVTTLLEVMQYRGLHVEKEQYVVDKDGARLFGTFDLSWMKLEEYGSALGFRHAVDKSMSIQCAIGVRVFVCSNMSMSGDMITVRKHTSKLDLGEELDRAMYKYMQGYKKLQEDIEHQKEAVLDDRKCKTLLYDIFAQRIMPLRKFPLITEHYATMRKEQKENPAYFTGWWLHNVMTANVKDMKPAPAFQATARLGRFFAEKF